MNAFVLLYCAEISRKCQCPGSCPDQESENPWVFGPGFAFQERIWCLSPYALTYEELSVNTLGSLARFESMQAFDKRPSRSCKAVSHSGSSSISATRSSRHRLIRSGQGEPPHSPAVPEGENAPCSQAFHTGRPAAAFRKTTQRRFPCRPSARRCRRTATSAVPVPPSRSPRLSSAHRLAPARIDRPRGISLECRPSPPSFSAESSPGMLPYARSPTTMSPFPISVKLGSLSSRANVRDKKFVRVQREQFEAVWP